MKNLYLTVFIHSVGFSIVFPLLPFYAQIFHATAFQIGILAAAPFIFSGTMLFIIALAILLLLNIRNIKTSDVAI